MLLPKKSITSPVSYAKVVPIQGYRRQLEKLYARRSAVETLIQSLERYERFRAHKLDQKESKTA